MSRNNVINFCNNILKNIFILFTLLILVRCGEKTETTSTETAPNFSSIYTNVLSKNCVQCHEPSGSATINNGTRIDFTNKAIAYQTLTSYTSSGYSANLSNQCTSVYLVVPGAPTNSYLLATLSESYHRANFMVANCTPYSPNAHGASLNSTDLNAMVQWITSGALND